MRLLPRGRRDWLRAVLLWVGLLVLAAFAVWWVTGMPGRPHQGPRAPLSGEEAEIRAQVEAHVRMLAGEIGERNLSRPDRLAAAASYVAAQLSELGYAVASQEFDAAGVTVRNLEAERRGSGRAEELVIVGAHYDSVVGSPGANDNATGVAATLEIARLLTRVSGPRTVRCVLFVNEEPPYFPAGPMGSRVYARRARERGERIVAMLSLETIGYYSDEPGSQLYPFPLGLFYPSTGNFVGFVGNLRSRRLVRRAIASFRRHTAFPSEGAAAPGWIMGVGWSDHRSFWEEGYPAIMVTDTALFRYPAYHTEQDTPDKLVYDRTARVVAGLYRVILDLAGEQSR